MELRFDEYWPQWPREVEGTLLLDVWLECEFSHLMNTLWAADSTFLSEANKERHFSEFNCTDWVESESDLPDLPGGFSWTCEPTSKRTIVGDIGNKLRKVRFANQKGNGLTSIAFKSEELQRCVLYDINKKCIVDACVSSTAPFCENIRAICRYTCEASNERITHLSVKYHVVYLRSVNAFVKYALERGARDGLKSNYETYLRVLSTHIPVASEQLNLPEKKIHLESPPSVKNLQEEKYGVLQNCPAFIGGLCGFREMYESLINWSTLPPIAFFSSLFLDKESSRLIKIIWRFLAVFLHVYILSFLFGFYSKTIERFLSLTRESYIVPDLTFQESIFASLLLLIVLEVSNLLLYTLQQILTLLKQGVVYCGTTSWNVLVGGLRRKKITRTDSAISNYSDALDSSLQSGEIIPETSTSGISPYAASEAGSRSGTLSSFYRTVANLKFSSLYSNDSQRGLPSLSIEDRTNPDGSVVEEIFENERLQPFRGWGHSWPGHFLPTDPHSHWSTFASSGERFTSDHFAIIEPHLPLGWEWIDRQWTIDKVQDEENSIDQDGWYYALDFPWLKFSRERNGGIKKTFDCVRRRRLYRTRRRLPIPEEDLFKSEDQSRENQSKHLTVGRIDSPYFSFFHFL